MRKLLVAAIIALMPFSVSAQSYDAAPAAVYTPAQLDQMVAPIALYPDQLVAQILMASTYPLELVEAERWLQNPANAGLQGDQLAAVVEQAPWDPSVKSLLAFPQVLKTLNDNLEWTEQLGDAFLAQQADGMSAVQYLRVRAEQSGALQSNAQQLVEVQGSNILIEPANSAVVYVPYYNPATVYGAWPYPDYEPYYFSSYANAIGVGLGFAAGVAIIQPLWAWHHWDWRARHIDIDNDRFARLNEGHVPPHAGQSSGGQWHYDPDHRHGVPFQNASTAARVGGGPNAAPQSNYRGYPETTAQMHAVIAPQRIEPQRPQTQRIEPQHIEPQHIEPIHHMPEMQPRQEMPRQDYRHETTPVAVPEIQRPQPQILRQAVPQQAQPQIQIQQQVQQRQTAPMPAPMFESFPHGQEAHQQEARGAQSRGSMPQQGMPAGNEHHAGDSFQGHEGH